ncbi:DNA primase [Serinibacter salmoneus]|uniref:DNA primase n=1 Tax=Serinibacter salmoneus TaxID=556530 RepID=A0A2A9D0J6_9MICO|nr:DNA primase [Serinibacter salmoneus]PFG19911.1 DNA primase [Serinibacter salmoneus]
MAARLTRDSIAQVREASRIEEVVGEQVSLKPAGVGSMKGLCPFHDERTPSFHVRPQMGLWHCFGCGEGGDVISFVQRIDHLPFVEAVERLAGVYNVQLAYEDDGGAVSRPREEPGRRQRLVEAHRAAAEFYSQQLLTPEASKAREFLAERGFDRSAATTFGVGYAPKGWDNLMRHLSSRGFTQAELAAGGLVSQGNRGYYDRFRGRLMWPIRDVAGDVIGFGARKLYDDDPGPKYLNTPESPIYHKAQVLYGIDLAKKAIASNRQVVVVEGYTDVMACHLAGITTAVATCGTAFGSDHVRVVRRLLGDSATGASGVMLSSGRTIGGEVVFTFDGDEAGRKAAMRAFGEDQAFAAQTFVAISEEGLDPCDVRVQQGDAALARMLEKKSPMFAFAIRSALAQVNLTTAEGRVTGLDLAAPVVATIRDYALRSEYARQLAGWLGMDPGDVRARVGQESRSRRRYAEEPPPQEDGDGAPRRRRPTPIPDDPVARLERQVLEVALQFPAQSAAAGFDALDPLAFGTLTHRAIHDAIRAAGGVAAASPGPGGPAQGGSGQGGSGQSATAWLTEVLAGLPEELGTLVREMTVATLPTEEANLDSYALGVIVGLRRLGLTRRIADLRARLNQSDPADDPRALLGELQTLEGERHRLAAS